MNIDMSNIHFLQFYTHTAYPRRMIKNPIRNKKKTFFLTLSVIICLYILYTKHLYKYKYTLNMYQKKIK